jgi:hypothetical protein
MLVRSLDLKTYLITTISFKLFPGFGRGLLFNIVNLGNHLICI